MSLQVESARNVAEVRVPYGESRAEELGQQRRKVTGEGYFSGPDCMERWAALQRAYAQEGPGRLQLPGLTPFWALMDPAGAHRSPGKGPGSVQLFLYGMGGAACLFGKRNLQGAGRGKPVGLRQPMGPFHRGAGRVQPSYSKHQ